MLAKLSRRFAVFALLATVIGGSSALADQRTLTVYRSLDEDQAKALADGFMAANGRRALCSSTGSPLSSVRAGASCWLSYQSRQ